MTSFTSFTQRINRRLALQILLPLLSIFLLMAIIGGTAIHASVEISLREQLIERAHIAADSAQFAVESANTLGTMQRFVSALAAEDEFRSVTVMAGNPLRIVASSHMNEVNKPLSAFQNSPKAEILKLSYELRQTPHHKFQDNQFWYGSSVLILGVSENGLPLGAGAVVLEMNPQHYRSAKRFVSSTLILVMLTILAVILVCTLYLLQRLILTPQKALLQTLDRRKNNEKILCPVKGENEISAISQSLNELFLATDQVDELKTQFVSTVSHELRTPLTSIRGALGLVLGAFAQTLDPKIKELLATADRNAEQLARLINDLLDLEKMASGKMTFTMEDSNLCQLAREAITSIEPYAAKHGIKLHFNAQNIQQFAVVDKTRILQVLFNLLSNAIKFSADGESVILSLQENPQYHQLSVKDFGRGIPEEFRAKMFQRFAQADSTDAREKGGTGLGLNIVQMIVQAHGGKVEFFSETGKGTEFFIKLPKHLPAALTAAGETS